MPETFCLRLTTGLALALLILPARTVSARFFRSHLLIGLFLLITAGVFAWNSATEALLLWGSVGAAIGLSVMAFWLWSAEGVRPGVIALGLLATALGVACLSLPGKLAEGWLRPALDELSSAAFLGVATTAMLLGHWYLIAPTMSMDPLLRLLTALFVANAARLATAAIGVAFVWESGTSFDRLAWLWLVVRWAAGLLAPLVLTWMAWQSARIRSTQSATGILYVVVIFVFFGELTDLILQGHLAQLGGGER
jgi:hypothetical protein